jgi:hypothetical protein
MPLPLTINSFLLGYRTEAAKVISNNPFYHPLYDRASAELGVHRYGFPVLRESSRRGLYAITYRCLARGQIVHTLLRQNADLSIDVLNDDGATIESYTNIYELLALVLWRDRSLRRSPPLLPSLAPSLVPILPAAVGALVGDASRAAVITTRTRESVEDPTNS